MTDTFTWGGIYEWYSGLSPKGIVILLDTIWWCISMFSTPIRNHIFTALAAGMFREACNVVNPHIMQ